MCFTSMKSPYQTIPVLVEYIMQATKIFTAFQQMYALWLSLEGGNSSAVWKKESRSFGSRDPRWSHHLFVLSPVLCSEKLLILSCTSGWAPVQYVCMWWRDPYQYCIVTCNLTKINRIQKDFLTNLSSRPSNYFWDTTWVGQVLRHAQFYTTTFLSVT